MISRRRFLGTLAFAAAGSLALPRRLSAAAGGPHPEPRPGITADKVPAADQLGGNTEVIAVFDQVREIPEVIDGIRCQCGCADMKGYYSLLTCFETTDAMARQCRICQGLGKLAYRMNKAGSSLDEIRRGIEAKYG
jgi:hypothetical protein